MAARKPIRIRFVGDISFNNRYIDLLESGQEPFEADFAPVLKDADLDRRATWNALAEGSAENEKKVPRIKTSVKAFDALKDVEFWFGDACNEPRLR